MKLSNLAAVKSTCQALALGAALFVVGLPAANAYLTVNYASDSDADDQVLFNGGSFVFDSHFRVGTVHQGTNNPTALTGFLGNITGTYTVGADYSGYPNTLAHVSGTGVLTILDSNNKAFTADVDWINIAGGGTNVGLNYFGAVNLTNRQYSGVFSDLQTLVSASTVWSTLTFQFPRPTTTSDLRVLNQGTEGVSYSGTIYTPIPAAAWLFGSALLGMGAFGRSKQLAKKEETAA